MKFRKSLSVFLAVLMIFTSFPIVGSLLPVDYSITAAAAKKTTVGKVSGLKAIPGKASVKLVWSSAKSADKYQVLSTDSKGKQLKVITTTDKTTYTVTKLKTGKTYYYAVLPVLSNKNGIVKGTATKPVAAVTSSVPAKVIGLNGKTVTDVSVTLEWESSPEVKGYTVYSYNKSKKTYTKLGTSKKNVYTVKGLKGNTSYAYAVSAYTVSGKKTTSGKTSDVLTVKTKKAVSIASSIIAVKGEKTALKLNNSIITGAKTSKSSVVAVTSKGEITAKKTGTATITLTDVYGNPHNCTVKVESPYLSKKTVSVSRGTSYTLKLVNNTQKLKWSTSDKSIATVSSSGKVTGVKTGSCTITAKTASGTAFTCKVTVEASHTHTVVVDKAVKATCTTKGLTEGSHCSVCGKVITKQSTIPALGHKTGKTVKDTITAGSCTEDGLYKNTVYCAVCEKQLSVTNVTVKATGHKASATYKTNVIKASCTEDGSYTEQTKCTVCSAILSSKDYIEEAKGHTLSGAVQSDLVSPTCVVKGSYKETITCTKCGTVLSSTYKYIDALGHKSSAPVKEKEVAAQCTENGSYDQVVYCSVCKAEISRNSYVINKTGHKPVKSANENVLEATCYSKGKYDEVYKCSVCLQETSRETKNVDKLPHTPAEPVKENVVAVKCTSDGSYDEVVKCSVCTAEISRTHKTVTHSGHTPMEAVSENKVEANCTENGSYDEVIKCSVCLQEISRTSKVIPKTNHSPLDAQKEDIQESTCSQFGSYNLVVRCSKCTAVISSVPQVIEKLPHTPGQPAKENEVAPSCAEEGSYDEAVYCTVCTAEISRTYKTVATVAHTPDTPVEENTVQPQCLIAGSYDEVVYCKVCLNEISRTQKSITALEHEPGTPVTENEVDVSCVEDGSYDEVVYCLRCETELSRTAHTVTHEGHSPLEAVKENVVNETCTEGGSYDSVVYCSKCSNEISRTNVTVNKLGHSFINYISDNNATCTEDGTKTATCERNNCNETDKVTDTGSKLGHSFINYISNNNATCTEDGTKTATCERNNCNETDTVTDTGTATGHKKLPSATEDYVARSLTEGERYNEVIRCEYCTQIISSTAKTGEAPYLSKVAAVSTSWADNLWQDLATFDYSEEDKLFTTDINSSEIEASLEFAKLVFGIKNYALEILSYAEEKADKIEYVRVNGITIYENGLFVNSGIEELAVEEGGKFFGNASMLTNENNTALNLTIEANIGHGDEIFDFKVTVSGEKIAKIAEYAKDIWDIFTFDIQDGNYVLSIKVPESLMTKVDNILKEKGSSIHSIMTGSNTVDMLLTTISGINLENYLSEKELGYVNRIIKLYNDNLVLGNKLLDRTEAFKIGGADVLSGEKLEAIEGVNSLAGALKKILSLDFRNKKVKSFVNEDGTISVPVEIEYNVASERLHTTGVMSKKVTFIFDVDTKYTLHQTSKAVQEQIVPATCYCFGTYNEVIYCSVCNTVISSTPKNIQKLSHSFTNYVSNGDATCYSDGTKTATCDTEGCNEKNTITDGESKLPHTPNAQAVKENETLTGYDMVVRCSVCTQVVSSEHITILTRGDFVLTEEAFYIGAFEYDEEDGWLDINGNPVSAELSDIVEPVPEYSELNVTYTVKNSSGTEFNTLQAAYGVYTIYAAVTDNDSFDSTPVKLMNVIVNEKNAPARAFVEEDILSLSIYDATATDIFGFDAYFEEPIEGETYGKYITEENGGEIDCEVSVTPDFGTGEISDFTMKYIPFVQFAKETCNALNQNEGITAQYDAREHLINVTVAAEGSSALYSSLLGKGIKSLILMSDYDIVPDNDGDEVLTVDGLIIGLDRTPSGEKVTAISILEAMGVGVGTTGINESNYQTYTFDELLGEEESKQYSPIEFGGVYDANTSVGISFPVNIVLTFEIA